METLILTHGYLPHRIVGWQTAISLFFTGKVEVVETYDEVIRSVSTAVPMPAVVRLTRAVKHHDPRIRFSRINVLTRDGFRCQYCGDEFQARDLTFDHVLPRSQGGRTTWENIVSACRHCNAQKGNRTPEQARMKLLARPQRPTGSAFRFRQLHVGRAVPERWKDWVWWTANESREAS